MALRFPIMPTVALKSATVLLAVGASALLAHCSSTTNTTTGPLADAGTGTDGAVAPTGSDGPDGGANPNAHATGDATKGKDVFRFETFGNEGFWTVAAKLPQGIVAAKLTPVQALTAGLSVDVEKLDAATQQAVAAEIMASGATGPILNNPATTIKLINANAVIGVVVKDTNNDGMLDVANGDRVGVSCVLCHSVTDKSVFNLPTGGSIGKRIDGPAVHTINVGAILAMAANSRALYPMLQLKGPNGESIGRAPSSAGLTKDSTEAEVDAYFSNPAYYPIGMFDDTVDGNGNPMHNTPMFRADLGAPWGSAGELSKLDQFANTVYTVLLDPTNLLTAGGKAFLHKVAGAAGDKLATDYAAVLLATGVPAGADGYPFLMSSSTTMPGDPDGLLGIRVDNTKLLDLNAYLNSLPSPKGAPIDATVAARARAVFRGSGQCTSCHNVDQSKFVPSMVLDLKTVFPGDKPTILAMRDAPLSPVEDTPGNTFDDKMIVINASLRGLVRGSAMPLLMDLARKPVFLHDNSVPTLDNLFDPSRGPMAPHPFYLTDATERADMVIFMKSLDDTSK